MMIARFACPDSKVQRAKIWGPLGSSTLLNHHLGRFDDDLNGIALLQSQFLGAIARNHALDEIVPNLDDNVRHDIAHLDVLDRTGELISSG